MTPPTDTAAPHALPQNVEAEAALLGSLILDNLAIGEVLEIVKPDAFFKSAHRTLYELILELYDRRQGVDLVTLNAALEERGLHRDVGGPDALAALTDAVHSTANAVHYAGIVRNKGRLRRLQGACQKILANIQDPAEEAENLIEAAEKTIFDAIQSEEKSRIAPIEEILREAIHDITDIRDGKRAGTGLSTGIHELDSLIGGLRPSQLIIVAGRPGMGKSSLALRMIEQIGLVEKKGVLFFSMEMDRHNIAQNMLCSHCRVNASGVRKGFISDEEFARIMNGAGAFEEAPIFIDDTPGLSMLELRARARRMKMEHDIQAIFLDYMQFMETRDLKRAENRQQEIAQISRQLKTLARELDVPVIALSQLSRAAEKHEDNRPKLSDLRESGAIEQDADVVMLLYRDEYYNPNSPEKGTCEIIVAKQRNGPTGDVKATFLGEFMRFEPHSVRNYS